MDQNIEVESDQLSTNCAQRVLCIYIYTHTHVSIFVSRNAVLSRSSPTLSSKRFQTHPNCGRASWHHVLSTRMEHETHTHETSTHTFCAASFNRPLALGLYISKGFLTKIMNYNDYFYDHIFIIIYQH